MTSKPEWQKATDALGILAEKGYNVTDIMSMDYSKVMELAYGKQVETTTKPKRRKMRKVTVTILTETEKEYVGHEIEGLMEHSYDCFYSWDYRVTEVYVDTEE